MTTRNLCNAIAAGLLTCGMVALAPERAQAQAPAALPEKGGPMTLVGCLQKQKDTFVLASPTVGAATSAPEAACPGTAGEHAVKLEGIKERTVDQSMLGHWVQVSGNLEKVEGKSEFRELNVKSMRSVPVLTSRTAEAAPVSKPQTAVEPPSAAPQAEAPAPQTEQPVATSGVTPQSLPHTASALPLIGLIGLLSLAGGLALYLLARPGVQGLG